MFLSYWSWVVEDFEIKNMAVHIYLGLLCNLCLRILSI